MHRDPYVYSLHKGSPFTFIIFTSNDEASSLYEDALVHTLLVRSCDVCLILVNYGSSIYLIFLTTNEALWVKDSDITKKEMPLRGFNSSTTHVFGTMVLPIDEEKIGIGSAILIL